jgi:hypothetical protein
MRGRDGKLLLAGWPDCERGQHVNGQGRGKVTSLFAPPGLPVLSFSEGSPRASCAAFCRSHTCMYEGGGLPDYEVWRLAILVGVKSLHATIW